MSLEQAVSRLVAQVAHWTPARWSKPMSSGVGSRADAMYALIQHVADAAAEAEGLPQRTVPRLTNNLVLPDQLRVVSADLAAAATTQPELLADATTRVQTTAAAL